MNESLFSTLNNTEDVNLISKVERRIIALKELNENLKYKEAVNKINHYETNPSCSRDIEEITQVLAMYVEFLDLFKRPPNNGKVFKPKKMMNDLDARFYDIIDKNLGGSNTKK